MKPLFVRALPIPAALFVAALLSRGLLLHAPRSLSVDLGQPLIVVTNWHQIGAALLALLALALAAGTVAYTRIVRAIGDASLTAIVAMSLVALAAAWCVPVFFSSDVYAYAAYGELARLGGDPYAHAALGRGDAIFDAAIWQWGNPLPACVYGPAFVWIARAMVGAAATLGTLAQLDGFRLLSSGALLLCALLAYAAYPGDRTRRLTAAATIGLNPVAIWCAAEGHNDALALTVVLGGCALARRGLLAAGAFAIALSASIKAPGIIAAVPAAFASRRGFAGAAAGAAVVLAFSLPLLGGTTAHLTPLGHYAPQASLQAVFAALPPLAIVVALAACALLATRAIGLLRRHQNEGWIYLALAGWVLIPNPYPWYGLWLVAVAALAPASRAATAAILVSLAALLRYVPDAVATPGEPAAVLLGIAAALALLPLR